MDLVRDDMLPVVANSQMNNGLVPTRSNKNVSNRSKVYLLTLLARLLVTDEEREPLSFCFSGLLLLSLLKEGLFQFMCC